jgi:hypothetical protein
MTFNYRKICQEIISPLPERVQDILFRRFGIEREKKESLEAIGKSYGITRERVRQIEEWGFSKIKPKAEKYQGIFQYFTQELKKHGNLKREDLFFSQFADEKFWPHLHFLLTLGDSFERIRENPEVFSLWTIDQNSFSLAQKLIEGICQKIKEINQPLEFEELFKIHQKDLSHLFEKPLSSNVFLSYLEISKKIKQNYEGKFGLPHWPEINPKGIGDKAYLVLKKENRPLHFREITEFINKLPFSERKALVPTVHNELIRNPQFVLIGRGIYALSEWGYQPGFIKDIIFHILKTANIPLSKEEIIKEVLKQRQVAERTILLNLEKYFQKNSKGKYYFK